MVHESHRGYFARALYEQMAANDLIWLISADLGYKVLDSMFEDFPERCLNTGAAEQTAVGAGVGLALSNKIPLVYSITSFLFYRPFEWIRNYLNHEEISVKLVGSGLDDDYKHDGFSHQTFDAKGILSLFPAIKTYFPEYKEDVPDMLHEMLYNNKPSFLCLRR